MKKNTVCDTKEQVDNMLSLFEEFGMLPPPGDIQLIAVEKGHGGVLEINYDSDDMWDSEDE